LAVLDLSTLEVNIPSRDFGEYSISLAAYPKFGKSEFCTKFEKPLIFDFEEGTKGKVTFRVQITKWSEVKGYIKQLTKEPSLKERYRTVCFDTTNYALEACKSWCIDQYMDLNPAKIISTFNEIPWGGGWEMLTKEFKTEINKLKRAGYGVVLVSHIKDKIFDKETEAEHTKTVPDLSDKERNMISAIADFLLLGEFERETIEPAVRDGNKVVKEAVIKTNRVLYLRTTESAEAGFRWGSSKIPEKIPFDFNTLKNIFSMAVESEIADGLEKFGLTEEKADEIRKNIDAEKLRDEEESFKENLSELLAQITNLLKTLKASGVKVADMKDVLAPLEVKDPNKVDNVELANKVIKALESLLVQ